MALSDITPMTWTDSAADLTDANFNTEIRDSYSLLLSPPSAGIDRSSNQTISNTTWTVVSFNTLLYDTLADDTPQWASGSPTKLTCQLDGWYEVVGSAIFSPPSGRGIFISAIRLGGTTDSAHLYGGSSVSTNGTNFNTLAVCTNVLMNLSSGDDIYLMIYQSTGASQTLASVDYSPVLSMVRRRGI